MSIGRRDFLKTIGSASLAGGALSYSGLEASAVAEPGDALFDFADDRVPMNSANLCPMLSNVSTAVAGFGSDLDRDMSGPNRQRIEAMKEDGRARIAALLGVSADEIAIVRNTSEANSTIVQGMPLAAGDEVLLWDQNHPSNAVAWDVQAARSGCTVKRLSVPLAAGSIDEVVSIFENAIGPKTRVVSFTHISNVTGFRLPAYEICAAVRRKGNIHIHVDGAQTWGIVDVDLRAMDCDSFSGSAHKWFMGPRETGMLYVQDEHIESIWPNVVTAGWGGEIQPSPAGARKFEVFGQRDDASLAALGDAAEFHESLTPAVVEEHATRIADNLREGLSELGVPFVSSRNPSFTSNVIILAAEGDNADKMVDRVFQESGVITAATGGFRMSPHVYNTDEHVDRVLNAIAKTSKLLSPPS